MSHQLKSNTVAYAMFAIFIMMMPATGMADTLTLNDGQTLKGKLIEQTETNITFSIGGQALRFDKANIEALSIDFEKSVPTAVKSKPEPQAASAASLKGLIIPAGTILRIKTTSQLDTIKNSKGDPFVAILDSAVIVNGQEALRSGTKIIGRVTTTVKGGRLAKRAKLIIELTEIELPGNTISIRTEPYGIQGERQGTLRKVAIGAAVGSIENNNRGAQRGSAYGGVAAAATRGNQTGVPSGKLIEFKLVMPVTL